jgi:membrane protease YdiL (CAAX protease family)
VLQVGAKVKRNLKETQETEGTGVEHPSSPVFHAQRHLVFACVALLHAPLSANAWSLVESFLSLGHPWSVELELVSRLLPLCFAVFVAWLAFDRFDTGSGVTMLPTRWVDVGALVLLAYGVREAVMVGALRRATPVRLTELKQAWIRAYVDFDGSLLLGWVILAAVAIALAEELVYRALLLRALEGFMSRWSALVMHALVFELAHIFVYGQGFRGGVWFIMALIYGCAFQRTRSIAVPVFLHATSLVLHHSSLWLFAP